MLIIYYLNKENVFNITRGLCNIDQEFEFPQSHSILRIAGVPCKNQSGDVRFHAKLETPRDLQNGLRMVEFYLYDDMKNLLLCEVFYVDINMIT